VKARELVRGEIVIRDATAGAEVLAVGASIEGAEGHHKPQPIGRGDLSPAPHVGQRQRGLVIDEPRVGMDQRLGAEVVLQYPAKTIPCQGGMVRAEQWFQANITGFGHESSTKTDSEITHSGVRGTDVHKLVGKAGPGMHF